jgi:hypothetical protein
MVGDVAVAAQYVGDVQSGEGVSAGAVLGFEVDDAVVGDGARPVEAGSARAEALLDRCQVLAGPIVLVAGVLRVDPVARKLPRAKGMLFSAADTVCAVPEVFQSRMPDLWPSEEAIPSTASLMFSCLRSTGMLA